MVERLHLTLIYLFLPILPWHLVSLLLHLLSFLTVQFLMLPPPAPRLTRRLHKFLTLLMQLIQSFVHPTKALSAGLLPMTGPGKFLAACASGETVAKITMNEITVAVTRFENLINIYCSFIGVVLCLRVR